MQRFRETRHFVKHHLPALNKEVFKGSLDAEAFTMNARPAVTGILTQISDAGGASRLSRREARAALQLLDFIVGSVERHHQTQRRAPGEGLAALPGAEPQMIALGEIAGTPPKGTAYSRWVDNEDGITFTGDPQESLFDDVVRVTHALVEETADLLRPIADGSVGLISADTVDRLARGAQLLSRAHAEYERLQPPDFTPRFFAFEMRTYLPTYAIGGKPWGGVSAANLGAFWSLDFLLGTTSDALLFDVGGQRADYAGLVAHKLENVPVEIQQQVRSDGKQASVATHIFCLLDAQCNGVLDEGELASRIQGLRQGTEQVVAFARCVKAWASLAAYHLSLIKSHLVKAADDLPPHIRQKVLEKLAVPTDEGSGGMGLGEVEAITFMRARHPMLKMFTKAVLSMQSRAAA